MRGLRGLGAGALIVLAACGSTSGASNSGASNGTFAPAVVSPTYARTPQVTAPATPSRPPATAPAPISTTQAPTPAPLPTPTPPTAANLCGAPPNPWGYNFCGGSYIYAPPSSFCSYFSCIANFWNGRGYVMQCVDSTFSKSGGISGSCSYHKGNWRALRSS